MRSVLSLSMLIVGVMVMVVPKVEAQIPLEIIKLLAGLPDCTINCLSGAVMSAGCAVGNQTCTCDPDNKAIIQANAKPCLLAACDTADILFAKNITVQVCLLYDAEIANNDASVATELLFAPSSTVASSSSSSPSSTSSISLSSTSTISTFTTVFATQSSSLSSSVSSSTGTALTSTSASSSPPQSSKSTGGLTPGAKAGIGVAAAFGGVLLLGGLILCCLGYRVRRKDLGHLAWIDKRGVVRGRVELDATKEETDERMETPPEVPSEVGDVETRSGIGTEATTTVVPPPPPPPMPPAQTLAEDTNKEQMEIVDADIEGEISEEEVKRRMGWI